MNLRIAMLAAMITMDCGARIGAQQPGKAIATVEQIQAYAGTWKVETESFTTPQSKVGHDSKMLVNDCWKSGVYLACRQIVDGDPKVLIVFTCSGRDNTCTSYQIPPDGSDAHSGRITIDGDTWTFPWRTTEGGRTTWFRVVNTWASATRIEYRQEFSTDQAHWTPMSVGHEVKAAEPSDRVVH
jgi:hypothetical protein